LTRIVVKMVDFSLILMLALLLDIAFGEPSNKYHPVSWLGNIIALEMSVSPKEGKWRQILFGGGVVILSTALIVALLYLTLTHLKQWSRLLYIITAAFVLKISFSLRGLLEAVDEVKKLLTQEDLARARHSLKSLVSRNTTELDKKSIISATIESAAENTCDSFTAPLFYFFIFGVPGAIAYRIINTFDAMIGYHGEWEYLGKTAARMDDIANYIPARLTGLAIVLAAGLCGKDITQAWSVMLRDHCKTESPNSGWTMSAFAGALQVQLEKHQAYKLGSACSPLLTGTINEAEKIVAVTAAIWVLMGMAVKGVYFAAT